MEHDIQLTIADVPVRFTFEGQVYVVDAIRAVCENRNPGVLWNQITKHSPELLDCISEFKSDNSDTVPVVDSKGWEKVQDALIDMIFLEESKK